MTNDFCKDKKRRHKDAFFAWLVDFGYN